MRIRATDTHGHRIVSDPITEKPQASQRSCNSELAPGSVSGHYSQEFFTYSHVCVCCIVNEAWPQIFPWEHFKVWGDFTSTVIRVHSSLLKHDPYVFVCYCQHWRIYLGHSNGASITKWNFQSFFALTCPERRLFMASSPISSLHFLLLLSMSIHDWKSE